MVLLLNDDVTGGIREVGATSDTCMAHSTGVDGRLSHEYGQIQGTENRREVNSPAWNPCNTTIPDLLSGALSRFDLDNLATTVLAAGWANVVRLLHAATLTARHQRGRGEKVMATSVTLAMATDFLFWKSTHCQTPYTALADGIYVYRHPGDARTRGAIAPRYPTIPVVQQIDHLRQIRHRCLSAADPGNPGHMLVSLAVQAQSTDATVQSYPARGRH